MSLFSNPPHSVDVYRPASGTDAGGGTTLAYTLLTSGVRGVVNSASSSEQELYAQMGITVSHTFVCAGASPVQRGDKLVYNGGSLHVVGINQNEAIGGIGTHTKVMLSQQL